MKRIVLCGLVWLIGVFMTANRGMAQIRFAYFDVDQLYDTAPSPFYDDTDYTPEGHYQWSEERYRNKIGQVAAVIDSMHCEVVALYGVENEKVVRDIALTLQGDYAYLHRTLNSLNGMDFALLYLADKCEPLRADTGRSLLTIEALIAGDTTDIVLGTDPRFVRYALEELCEEHPARSKIVAGRIAALDPAPFNLVDRLAAAGRRGHGNRIRNRSWQMRDRIFTSADHQTTDGAVYVRRELIDLQSGEPRPTYRSGRYVGGLGRYLPVWCRFR